jgi:D-alanyl-D-alanine-carboxypeptidase/D-alanyl-D-alanine-endopeptidase
MRNKIVAIALAVAAMCATRAKALGSEFVKQGAAGAQATLDAYFPGKPGGVVVGLIDADGSRLVTAGSMDDGSGRPVDGDTVFFIGSVSKTFTALLLAEMAARGEVGLDDAAAKYLPASLKLPTRGGKPITLLQLAINTAGLPGNAGNFTGDNEREQYETHSLEMMYEYLAGYELPREPGAEYEYSNLGMSLLGDVLARRAGKSYEELIVERICRPLGMTSTRVRPDEDMQARLATGRDEAGQPTGPWQLDSLVPAGGIHSTANDLLKYAAAQAGITTSALTPTMESTHAFRTEDRRGIGARAPFGRIAMPWMEGAIYEPPGMELLSHAGGAGSYHAWVGFDKLQRRGVVVLSTANHVNASAIGATLVQRLPLTEQRLHEIIQEVVGIGAALEVAADTGQLRIMRVLPETPAEAAGLTAGLVIETIDDVATRGQNLEECVRRLRGPEGSAVRLMVVEPESQLSRRVEVVRRKVRT